MSITVIKNGVRIATYHYKHQRAKKTLAALKAFYSAVYSGTKAKLTYSVEK